MYDFDHMLNGQGSRQHHQDILRWTQDERFASEVEAAQRHPLKTLCSPVDPRVVLLSFITALLTIFGRNASHKPSSGQDFAQASNS